MKEVSNQLQGNDNVTAAIDKVQSAMGNIAADTWSGKYATLGQKDDSAGLSATKCFGVPNLQIDGLDNKPTKGGCVPYTAESDVKPGKPGAVNSAENPIVKPEIPADRGLKDPIKVPSQDGGLKDPIKKSSSEGSLKDPIKKPSSEGSIKTPFKPYTGDSIEFGETFIKPVPKPGTASKPNSYENNSLEK